MVDKYVSSLTVITYSTIRSRLKKKTVPFLFFFFPLFVLLSSSIEETKTKFRVDAQVDATRGGNSSRDEIRVERGEGSL